MSQLDVPLYVGSRLTEFPPTRSQTGAVREGVRRRGTPRDSSSPWTWDWEGCVRTPLYVNWCQRSFLP